MRLDERKGQSSTYRRIGHAPPRHRLRTPVGRRVPARETRARRRDRPVQSRRALRPHHLVRRIHVHAPPNQNQKINKQKPTGTTTVLRLFRPPSAILPTPERPVHFPLTRPCGL